MDTDAPITQAEETALDKVPKSDRMALVRLDGTAITEDGNLVKHQWFKGLAFDAAKYSDIVLTPSEAQALQASIQRTKIGSSVEGIMICRGPGCPREAVCPLIKIQKDLDKRKEKRCVLPVGLRCPVEEQLFQNTLIKLAEEFEIDDEPNDFTDQRLILELAEIEIIESRMNAVLATKYQDFSELKLVSVFEDEDETKEHYVKDIADAFKVKERLGARKDKIRKDLVATRLDKRRMAAKENQVADDSSIVQANLLRELRRLQELTADQDAQILPAVPTKKTYG